ncbi:uncharacterized protein LOC144767884 [Lissotriton helveticus]
MSLQRSHQVPATLQEGSAYFSEEEWTLLQEWQTELYKKVTNEIQQALLSLGPLIASFSWKTKDKARRSPGNQQDPGCGFHGAHSTGSVTASSAVSLGIKVEETRIPKHPPEATGREGVHYPSTAGEEEFVSFIVKEEEGCFLDRPSEERSGSVSRPRGLNAFVHSTEQQHPRSWERTGLRSISDSSPVTNTATVYPNGKAFECDETRSNTTLKSNVSKPHKSPPEQEPSTWTGHEGCSNNSLNVKQNQDAQTRIKVATCSRCGVYYNQSTMDNAQQQNKTGNQRHLCAVCVKSLSTSLNVMKKAHTCSECGKSFKTSQLLVRHWRIHTGEKPYTCGTCGKSFRQTPHLIKHQLLHNREQKSNSLEMNP